MRLMIYPCINLSFSIRESKRRQMLQSHKEQMPQPVKLKRGQLLILLFFVSLKDHSLLYQLAALSKVKLNSPSIWRCVE